MGSTASASMVTDPLPNGTSDFVTVLVDQVVPHPENPRRIDDDHPSLIGLAESIRNTGLINAVVVRQFGNAFQILAGERRWRAVRKAGLSEILVRIVDVTDEQAFHIIAVENLQREDLHWTEEARGVESMVNRGWDVANIAAHIGRSEQWVRLRAKLAGISPLWRKEVEDPKSSFHGWPASMLELIARFSIETQNAMLGEDEDGVGDKWQLGRIETTAELATYLDKHHLRSLRAAGWHVDDAKLIPKAGACSACPKRSSCQQQLFADAKEDRCLDATCWREKSRAHGALALERARAKHPKAIILLSDGATIEDVPEKYHDAVRGSYGFQPAKAGDAKAKPAIVASGDKAGELVYVKEREYSGESSSGTKKSKDASPKDQLAQRQAARRKAVTVTLIEWFGADAAGGHGKKAKASKCRVERPAIAALMLLTSVLGVESETYDDDDKAKALSDAAGKKAINLEAVMDRLWSDVRESITNTLQGQTYGDCDLSLTRAIALVCQVDLAAIEKEVQSDLPLSKALAAIYEEDGTPKVDLVVNAKPKAAEPAKARAAAKPKPAAKAKPKAKAKSKA